MLDNHKHVDKVIDERKCVSVLSIVADIHMYLY